jgi:hypothetical protein
MVVVVQRRVVMRSWMLAAVVIRVMVLMVKHPTRTLQVVMPRAPAPS